MTQFSHLFTPIKIGSFTVRNRIVSTPHHPGLTDPDGLPGEREIAYWVGKARGGIGLIETARCMLPSAPEWSRFEVHARARLCPSAA